MTTRSQFVAACTTRISGVGLLLLASVATLPAQLSGQLISLKTVPIAAGDQFLIFPSENLGMGGVSIALNDRLLDPYVNPARGAHFGESQVFSSPTFYSVSNRAGSARTIPVGSNFTSRDWFGGVFVALQNLRRGNQFFGGPVPLFEGDAIRLGINPNTLSNRSSTNKYFNFHIGRNLNATTSLGASIMGADLGGIDGVEHLYALASGIAQNGNMIDVRVGLSKEFEGDGELEAVLLHHRFNMNHDVGYVDWFLADSTNWIWEPNTRIERNQDRSRTWGAHLGYNQPVGENGWRLGGIVTANRKLHPKIPNYEIMNIPRDPGYSNAFNLGVGLSKVTEKTKFGIDLIYEPAASETWAEAEGPVPTASGDTIPSGGKTVENSFDFSNAFINMGVAHQTGNVALQLGLRVSAYDFHLDQWDNVADTFRRQDEDWMEWVPSWGLTIGLVDLQLRYMGRVTSGTGRPGVAWTGAAADRAATAAAANDILLAPSGPLTLQDATVLTHQVSISIPIR